MKKWIVLGALALMVALFWFKSRSSGKGGRVLKALPPEQALSFRSMPSRTPATISFHNNTAQEVQLFWLDYEGRRQKFATLAPCSTNVQGTYAMHAWLCVDDNNRSIALFQARKGSWMADIGPPKKIE